MYSNSSSGVNCTSMWHSEDARLAVTRLYFWLSTFVAVLSVAGSLIIIGLYIRVKKLRSPGRLLLVFLSTADFFTATGNLVGLAWFADSTGLAHWWSPPDSTLLCKVQAGWSTLSSVASFSWSAVIAANIYVTAKYGSSYVTTRLAIPSHVLCWGLPAVVVSITAGFDKFGYDECTIYWCWVRRTYLPGGDVNDIYAWQLLTGKAWEVISVSITIVLFVLARRQLRKQQSCQAIGWMNGDRDVASTYKYANRKLMFVPLVFIISRIFGIIRFAINSPGKTSSMWMASEYMAPLQGMGDSSQGLLNCLVFVTTTRTVRQLIRHKLPHCLLPTQLRIDETNERSSLLDNQQAVEQQPHVT